MKRRMRNWADCSMIRLGTRARRQKQGKASRTARFDPALHATRVLASSCGCHADPIPGRYTSAGTTAHPGRKEEEGIVGRGGRTANPPRARVRKGRRRKRRRNPRSRTFRTDGHRQAKRNGSGEEDRDRVERLRRGRPPTVGFLPSPSRSIPTAGPTSLDRGTGVVLGWWRMGPDRLERESGMLVARASRRASGGCTRWLASFHGSSREGGSLVSFAFEPPVLVRARRARGSSSDASRHGSEPQANLRRIWAKSRTRVHRRI